jgi:hypothetical protein
LSKPFVDPPDHVNEIGNKFWHNELSTRYAQKDRYTSEGKAQKGLKGWTCWYVELTDGDRSMILVNDKQQVVYETQQLDALGVKIDVLKFLKNDKTP